MQEEFNCIDEVIQVHLANIVDYPGRICCLLTLMSLLSLQQPVFPCCHMDQNWAAFAPFA